MCGIAGVLALGGPDGDGVYTDGRILLVHSRLAIIDTGSGGAQPMRSGDGRMVIVQNGEIYNYREQRAALAARGALLRTQSDTEVLVEALALDGPLALQDFRGMWAFGCWDRTSRTLLLARDRIGKKPLLWTRSGEWLAFASEAAALLRLPFVRARLDRTVLPHWLAFQYAPSPHTLLEGIHKLPPATWMEVSAGKPAEEPVRWWRPPEPDPDARADTEWFERFDVELVESARLRTVSDVPVGVFLSGGVDSNVVLEALHRSGHRPIRTFTLGFEGLSDERARAAIGARRFADDHVELIAKPDLARDVAATLAHFADPLGDSAVVTTALLAREAAKHVKVIVNGDGGDELFGGYPRYPFARRADLAHRVPGALGLLRRRYAARANAVETFDRLAAGRPDRAAMELSSFYAPAEMDALLAGDATRACTLGAPAWPGARGPGLTDALFAWDSGRYLPDDLLVKVDVASMAHALENRSPLLDHRLFEHVGRLPAARRVAPRATKPLLRRHAEGRIAPEALAAPKRGFQLPLDEWLQGPLRGWLDGLLADGARTAPLFRAGAVRGLVDGFHAGRGGDLAPYRLWALAALELWARAFDVAIEP
jgi:asparagine synthase (glutamine-hydrolysing)